MYVKRCYVTMLRHKNIKKMAKKFYKINQSDLIYRVNIIRNDDDVTLETEELQAALDVKICDEGIKLFCYNLTNPKNIIVSFNCDQSDIQKCIYDDTGMIKSFITTSKRKINDFINAYQEKNPEMNIIVNDCFNTSSNVES